MSNINSDLNLVTKGPAHMAGLNDLQGKNGKVITITMPRPSPFEQARMEILQLSQREEFRSDFVLGGSNPPEMKKANQEKQLRFQRAKLEIIERHGVVREFARPILNDVKVLEQQLAARKAELCGLQSVCSHKNAQKDKKCPDCGLSSKHRR